MTETEAEAEAEGQVNAGALGVYRCSEIRII